VAKFLTKIALFDERKMAFLAAKSGGDLEKALSHKFNRVTFYNIIINDLPTHSVIPGKKSNSSGYPIFNSHLFFFSFRKEAKTLELFWQDFIE